MAFKTSEQYRARLLRDAEDKGASFLANVILTNHRGVNRKLRGLVNLLNAGHQVSVAQFSIDLLTIDGRMGYSFSVLEQFALGLEGAAEILNRAVRP